MKTLSLLLWSAAIALALGTTLHSQAPAAVPTPLEAAQKIKSQNAILLEKQSTTLQKLDEVAKEAQQIKFLGKRS